MKYFLMLSLLFCLNKSQAQKNYEFAYYYQDKEILKLTVANEGYKLDGIWSMIKAETDTNEYLFTTNDSGKYNAINTKYVDMASIYENATYTRDTSNKYFSVDTIFFKQDTLIGQIACKKVLINYVNAFINEEKAIVPYDTLRTTLFVAPNIKGPKAFCFFSRLLNGLVLKSNFQQPEYDASTGKLVKNITQLNMYVTTRLITDLTPNFFKLPANCTFYTNQDSFMKTLTFPNLEEELADNEEEQGNN